MDRQLNEALWANKNNWKRKGIVSYYCCPDDPRVIVPKPHKWMGWTVNFAHPVEALKEIVIAILIAVMPLLTIIIFILLFPSYLSNSFIVVIAAITISIVILVLRAKRLSKC